MTVVLRGRADSLCLCLLCLSITGCFSLDTGLEAGLGGVTCDFKAPDGRYYNLAPMVRLTGAEDFAKTVQVGQSIQFIYRLNICENTIAPCQGQPGAVSESLKIPAGETCRVLGRLDNMEFAALEAPPTPDNPNGEGLTLKYGNGDICDPVERSTRSVIVHIQCSISEQSAGVLTEMKKDDTCTTTFEMKSRHACSGSNLGWGSLFLVTVFLVTTVYCVCGSILNYKTKGAQGVEMLPHIEYWRELPMLVKDGLIFTADSLNRTLNQIRQT